MEIEFVNQASYIVKTVIVRINTLFSLFHQGKERDSRRLPDSGHTNSA